MASSSSNCRTYHVFLSFRGPDVRNGFVSHLYSALDRSGLYTYKDSEELRKGEQISPALMEAIEESRIAIVVFSYDYASSAWCLDELAKIMECKDQRDLIVIPVFYKVEPKEVRTPREDQRYAQAMADHEVKKPEKVEKWKTALLDAGRLSGWHYTDGDEAELIKDIVRGISSQLDQKSLHVATYRVGIDSRVEELKRLLNLESQDVLMVGLWGQGGVGKTTLAKAIYNAIFREFDGSSFLDHVRENSKNSGGLVHLQETMLSMLLGRSSTIYSVDEGIPLLQDRLCNKKVLLILDDVDAECQLNALAGNCKWFGEGSRIIITTRDSHLLTSPGIDCHHVYEVETLEDSEACELFRMHAFQGNQKIEVSSNLVDSVLRYASGLPLALGVLGSFLRGRGEREWESTLQKLAKNPNKNINNVLKVSYDGLENKEKEIFLDIACFFKGQNTEYITEVLDSCEFPTTIGIKILIERSLISEERGTLQMHDLTQLMCMDIVEEECRDDPGKRSRLWLHDDVCDVLTGDEETGAIKAIVLKLPEPEEMNIGPNAFTKMKKLRLLILHNVRSSLPGIVHLPNELRWFEWPHCAMTPEFRAGPKKLVGLDLQKSNIERVLKQFKDFKKLKFINFGGCQSLVNMPNLSFTPDLEELNICWCKNMERAHKSVTRLGKLRSLDLSGCSSLLSLPGVLQSENLERLSLANCSKVQILPINPNNTKCLRELDLGGTSIGELPASIGNLAHLEKMDLKRCKELSVVPSSIYRLQKLQWLSLEGCSKLIKFPKMEEIESGLDIKTGFPKLEFLSLEGCNLSEVEFLENPSCFPSLRELRLAKNNFTNLPACGHLYELYFLDVADCNQLQEICEIPRGLRTIWANDCESLSKIPSDIGDVAFVRFGSCYKLVGNVLAINDLFDFERICRKEGRINVTLPGGEMPDWLIPSDDGYISFTLSRDLFEKFLGLAVCVVIRVKGEKMASVGVHTNFPSALGNWEWFRSDSDHVWLARYKPGDLVELGAFSGPNDWKCVKFIIRASASGIVKQCGFRLIFKPLENDREVFLQHNPSLNPDLLYEVGHEGSQMSTWKKFPSETKDLQESGTSTEEDRPSMAGISIEEHRYSLIHPDYRNVHLGGEMPKEFALVEDGTIFFKASQNLYDKILGLALCTIFGVEDGEKEVSFSIVPYINDQRLNALSGTLGSFDLDHIWIQYLKANVLWGLLEGGVDFGQFDERCLQFSLRLEVQGGTMKKLGYVIRCRHLEDDLKVEVGDNQLVDLAALCEDSPEREDSIIHIGSWNGRPLPKEYLRKCHMHIEELEASDGESDQMWSAGTRLSPIHQVFVILAKGIRFIIPGFNCFGY